MPGSQACVHESHQCLRVRATLVWSGPSCTATSLVSALEVSVSWGLGGCGAAAPAYTQRWTFRGGEPLDLRPPSLPLPEAVRVSRGELPPQTAGQRPSSFHQLIIFTNLQARKKVHSGPNNPGQQPCGEAEGTEAGHRLSRPEATSCLCWASFLRLRTRPQPLWPSREGLTRSRDSKRPPALAAPPQAPEPSGLPAGSCLSPTGLCGCHSFFPQCLSQSFIRDAEMTTGPDHWASRAVSGSSA